jgi:hypothetical protein
MSIETDKIRAEMSSPGLTRVKSIQKLTEYNLQKVNKAFIDF